LLQIHSSVMVSPADGAPAGMSVDVFLGVGTALVVVTAVFVAMRIIANIQTKRLLIDDGKSLNFQYVEIALTKYDSRSSGRNTVVS
jgi:hypothetical protein